MKLQESLNIKAILMKNLSLQVLNTGNQNRFSNLAVDVNFVLDLKDRI